MNSPVLALCVGGVVAGLADRLGRSRLMGVMAAILVWAPPLGIVVGGSAVFASAVRSRVLVRQAERAANAHIGLLARSLLISVSAGMSLVGALTLASEQVHPLLAAEIRTVLGEAQRHGLATALGSAGGRGKRLYLLLARAQITGASTAGTLAAFVEERREAERAGSLDAARKLPVKLTIPLALLILPGFVVLTVGPSVLVAGRQLLGPVIP